MKLKKIMGVLLAGLVLSACNTEAKDNKQPECNHDWYDWEVIEPATCIAKGKEEKQCKICGTTETRDLEMDTVYGHIFTNKAEKLPTYSYKGYLAHKECDLCKKWYDSTGKEVDKVSVQLDEAGDDLAITVNGTEKGTFTKNTVPNNFGGLDVNWTISSVELKANDTITITKPGSVNTRYAFSGDSTLEKDKVKTAGTYDITLTSSPDGFILAFNAQNVQ